MPVLWPPFRTADFHKPLTFVGRQTLTSHFDFDCTLLMEFDAVRLSSRPQDQRRQQWSHSKSPGRISSEWCWISPARRDLGVSTESWTILKRASSKKLCQEMIISLRPRKCATVFFSASVSLPAWYTCSFGVSLLHNHNVYLRSCPSYVQCLPFSYPHDA